MLSEKELVLATRGKYDYVWGENVPFFLNSILGGASSLRGYNTNRFIDAGSILFNFEPRWTFWEPNGSLFQRFELSLGIDSGRVFNGNTFPPLPFNEYHFDTDVGITGILEGVAPLRLDYAFTADAGLVYLHLFYPF